MLRRTIGKPEQLNATKGNDNHENNEKTSYMEVSRQLNDNKPNQMKHLLTQLTQIKSRSWHWRQVAQQNDATSVNVMALCQTACCTACWYVCM